MSLNRGSTLTILIIFLLMVSLVPGAAPREDWGERTPTPHKGHFCKSSRTDEKKLGVWGITSPTIFEFQPELSSFQRPDLTYILSNLFFITVVLNLFFVF